MKIRSLTCVSFLVTMLVALPAAQAQRTLYDYEDTGTTSLNAGDLITPYNLTLRSSAATGTSGSGPHGIGQSLNLNASTTMGGGSGAYADISAAANGLSGLSAMTITGWFKAGATPTSGATLLRNSSGSGSTTDGWSLVFNGSQQLRLVIGSGSSATTYVSSASAYSSSAGTWQFFAVSWNSTTGAQWYVGNETTALTTAGSTATTQAMGSTSQRLTIGRSNSGGGAFKGELDDLRIYNSALTSLQTAAVLADANRTPRTGGSVLPYPEAWENDLDARRSDARQLYLKLLDRAIADNQPSQLSALTTAETNSAALSRYTLFLCYAQAYRASLVPDTATGAAAIVRADYIERARRGLFAVTTGIDSDTAAQATQLMFCQGALIQLYRTLVDLDALTPTEQSNVLPLLGDGAQAILDHVAEYGSFNRASCDAYGVAATARLIPGDVRASNWIGFSEGVWNDWKHVNDTFEDARGYNGLWLMSTFLQAGEMDLTDELDDPDVEAFFGRFTHLVAPNGTMPDFGGAFWDHGLELWPFAYEWLGAFYGRADFQENAVHVARYLESQPNIEIGQLEGLVEVCRIVAPSAGSVAARPSAVVTQRKTEFGDTVYDKLILRTGDDANAAYAAFDLHDQGYHGHADGGTLSLYTAGNSVLLHTLGREELFANQHQGVWAAPDTSGMLTSGSQHEPNEWTQWLVNFRWPGTYVGGYTLDIAQITGLFFRFDDPLLFSGTATLDVDKVMAIKPDGTAVQVHAGWTGSKVFSSGTSGESAFIGPSSLTLDLTDYDYLLVRWKSNLPDSANYFGFNGKSLNGGPSDNATLRTRASSRTVSAYAEDDITAPFGGFTRLMADAAGRLIRHQRDVRLRRADGALAVLDTFEFLEAGDYVVGPVWHSQNIVSQGASYVVARDDAQIILSGQPVASPVSSVRIDFGASEALSIITENYVTAHPQDEHFSAVCSGTRAIGDKVSILSFLRPGSPTAPSLIDVDIGSAELTDTIGNLNIETP